MFESAPRRMLPQTIARFQAGELPPWKWRVLFALVAHGSAATVNDVLAVMDKGLWDSWTAAAHLYQLGQAGLVSDTGRLRGVTYWRLTERGRALALSELAAWDSERSVLEGT